MEKEDIFEFIENNNLEQVKRWLKLYPNYIETNITYEYKALYLACYFDRLEMIKYLIDKGADINIKDYLGETLLHGACYYNRLEITKYLIDKGLDIHSKDNYGYTPLHIACRESYLYIVKFLLNKGADIDVKNNDGHTPLDYLNGEDRDIINNYIRYIKLESKIISLSKIEF